MSILIAPICKKLVSQTHKKRSSKRSGNVLAANRLLGAPVHPLDNFLVLEERHLSALRRYHGMKTHYNSMKLVAFQLKSGFPGSGVQFHTYQLSCSQGCFPQEGHA